MMKYPRPKNLNAPYPEDCEGCGTALTFSTVRIITRDVSSDGELDFSRAKAVCQDCHDFLLELVEKETERAGGILRHVHLSITGTTKLKDEEDDGTRH